jgi:hypothetical protein
VSGDEHLVAEIAHSHSVHVAHLLNTTVPDFVEIVTTHGSSGLLEFAAMWHARKRVHANSRTA